MRTNTQSHSKPKLFEEQDKIHNSEQDLRFSLSSETGVSWEPEWRREWEWEYSDSRMCLGPTDNGY